ncbi:MAG: hypothetical protein M3R38_11000 [Actinomycetota bacterium]|nr:hypothetical protein [Actinomycetota bacterium]
MTAEEIRQAFAERGWETGEPVGEAATVVRAVAGDYAIQAHAESAFGTDDPVFELCDRERTTVAYVRKIPRPGRTAELLGKYGVPADQSDRSHGDLPMVPPEDEEARI